MPSQRISAAPSRSNRCVLPLLQPGLQQQRGTGSVHKTRPKAPGRRSWPAAGPGAPGGTGAANGKTFPAPESGPPGPADAASPPPRATPRPPVPPRTSRTCSPGPAAPQRAARRPIAGPAPVGHPPPQPARPPGGTAGRQPIPERRLDDVKTPSHPIGCAEALSASERDHAGNRR